VIGDAGARRLTAARRHKHEHGYYVPFDRLVRLNYPSFVSFPHVPRLYSQTAGATHFLMLAENGQYRDGVIQLLRLVYAGTDQPNSLASLTRRSFSQLDEEYDRFLKTLESP